MDKICKYKVFKSVLTFNYFKRLETLKEKLKIAWLIVRLDHIS